MFWTLHMVELYRVEGSQLELVASAITNSDGRVDAPLLQGDEYRTGVYQVQFHAGDYYRARGVQLPEPAFLDVVVLRFGISAEQDHYHSRHLLRKSELKVADHVLLDPAAVMHSSMADLAHSVGISEPTIVRFCRAIGCSGFQDLKLKLAQSLAAGASFGQFAIHEDDSVADYSLKIFDTTLHTLMEVREKLDPLELQRAVTLMSQAQRVEFYGFGASGAVAADAQHKFFRLLLTAAAYSDPHMQAMSAVTLKPSDVAICISQSGRSKDLLITANLVRESGASLITLCPSQTPLAELSTVNLAIDVHEDTEIYTPLTSRIAHLVVIDVLAMGVAMARGPSLVNHLKS
eukprot:gene15650-15464_t